MSADASDPAAFASQPISQLLIKVATRCNIDCSYCYWFRDAAVYDKPKLMSAEVLQQLLLRIEEHITEHGLVDLPIILHGGEPLLWGVENFSHFAEACAAISSRTGSAIPIAVTTNGVLIDDRWLDCFEAHDISVAISIDGPAHIHDLHRRTFQGGGTHAAVERAARLLVSRDIRGRMSRTGADLSEGDAVGATKVYFRRGGFRRGGSAFRRGGFVKGY